MDLTLLKQQRKAKKISQGDIARQVGITQGYLSQIEKGKRTGVNIEIVESICTELGLELRILIK